MIGKDIATVAKKSRKRINVFIVVIGYFSLLYIKYQFQKGRIPFPNPEDIEKKKIDKIS